MRNEHHHAVPAVGGAVARLRLVLLINAVVFVAEVVTAVLSGSLALLADAGHMLTDSAGLVVALVAARLAQRPASLSRTWGWRRAEVIGAAIQAGMLTVVSVMVGVEAVKNLLAPPQVAPYPVLMMGVVGLAANVVGLWVLAASREESLNMKAAFLEVVGDALGSVAVIVGAVTIMLTGWSRADAVVSLVIMVLIVPRALKVGRQAMRILSEATPEDLDLQQVRAHLLQVEHVEDIHDLHASMIASGLPILSAHVVVRDECLRDGHASQILVDLQMCVREHFPVQVTHSTFQIEPRQHLTTEAPPCNR